MRCKGLLIPFALTVSLVAALPAAGATFGSVVSIGGHAADLALDEARGAVYVANFTANRIEVLSTADNTIHSSINVAAQPGALALSPNGQYLVVTHFGNYTAADTSQNLITLIRLSDNSRQTFSTGDTPLAVGFTKDGYATILTTSSVLRFDPATGALAVTATWKSLAKEIPADKATFPSAIVLAQLSVSADGWTMYAIANGSTEGTQLFFRYNAQTGTMYAIGITASPKPLPRVAVAPDGSWALIDQYRLDGEANVLAQYPNSIESTNIGGAVATADGASIYGQISTSTTEAATLLMMDSDNLKVQQKLHLPENITGRMQFTAAGDVIYSVSDSGVLILPVGNLSAYHRVQPLQTQLVANGGSCASTVISQYLSLTDPGGGRTSFSISSSNSGVTVIPSTGTTPATVQVRSDPNAFQDNSGTTAVTLTVTSSSAVNIPSAVRVLVSNRKPDQRGTAYVVDGTPVDVLADPGRNRFYVLDQAGFQVLVYDSSTFDLLATLRTSATPTQMAITFDRNYLMIGHDNSQQIWVYDLETYQQELAINMPPGHYPRSIAVSGKAILALSRDATSNTIARIDRVDFWARSATQFSRLGVYKNEVDLAGMMVGAANGGTILIAMSDGNTMLYDSNADSFTISRKDYTALSGGIGASNYGYYVVGNYVLNSSLVTIQTLDSAAGSSSGFTFVDEWGFRATAPATASAGVLARVTPASLATSDSARIAEAPLLATGWAKFSRTVAPLNDQSAIIVLTTSGYSVVPWAYASSVAIPKIAAVVNAADSTSAVAPGGLISIYGSNLSATNAASSQVPLSTALGESCLTVNGVAVPLLFVSSGQINGQLPIEVSGSAQMTLYTPGGASDNYNFTVKATAPSVFRSGSAGSLANVATVLRAANNELVTASNPIRPGDTIVIYGTGLGLTSPAVANGQASPSDTLARAVVPPTVTLGGTALTVLYSGRTPGYAGLDQINATVPKSVAAGTAQALVISQSGNSTTLSVRVVK
jgi:uncharacterized protein (TIGR03437 family)